MPDKENLFTEFPEYTKAEWLDKVAAELKTKPIESLYWKLDDLDLTPFYQQEDLQNRDQSIVSSNPDNDWKIGEDISSDQPVIMNKLLLEALANGVDAPSLVLRKRSQIDELATILKTVRIDFIEPSFVLKQGTDAAAFGDSFLNWLKKQGQTSQELTGGIFVQETSLKPSWVLEMSTALPKFRFLSIRVKSSDKLSDNLAQGIWEASQQLREYSTLGLPVDKINSLLQFSVDLGANYFLEIAKIRALKILWANILKAFDAQVIGEIYLEARLAENSQLEDMHQNMIRATTQSMSAVLAGVNCLNVLPADHFSGKPNHFTKRIARNIQHLLKMESYLDKVIDPAAGSYYMEELTQQIVQKTWTKFLLLEKEAGH